MRHHIYGKKLGRDRKRRQAVFRSLITGLFSHGQIKTTETRALAVRGLVDKLVSRAQQGTLQARRIVAAFLQNKKTVNKLVDEVAPRFKGRPGGFTRVVRLKQRKGDGATIVKMELVEGNEKPDKKKV